MAEQPPVFYPSVFQATSSGPSSGYVNGVQSSISEFDFTLSFLRSTPVVDSGATQGDRQELVSQVTMSPRYAKSLCALLQQNIAEYETRFGAIAGTPDESAPAHG